MRLNWQRSVEWYVHYIFWVLTSKAKYTAENGAIGNRFIIFQRIGQHKRNAMQGQRRFTCVSYPEQVTKNVIDWGNHKRTSIVWKFGLSCASTHSFPISLQESIFMVTTSTTMCTNTAFYKVTNVFHIEQVKQRWIHECFLANYDNKGGLQRLIFFSG